MGLIGQDLLSHAWLELQIQYRSVGISEKCLESLALTIPKNISFIMQDMSQSDKGSKIGLIRLSKNDFEYFL